MNYPVMLATKCIALSFFGCLIYFQQKYYSGGIENQDATLINSM